MNNLTKFSEAEKCSWEEEIKTLCQKMLHSEILLTKKQFLTEPEVCALLGVSDRTLRKYRQRKYLHCIKLDGCITYMKIILLNDLLRNLLQDSK